MTKYSLDKDKIKVLLLEGVHPNSVDNFKSAGYTNVEYVKGSLEEEALIEKKSATYISLVSALVLTSLKKCSMLLRNWLLLAVSASVPIRLIWMLQLLVVSRYSTLHSLTPVVWLNWY